jgi:hypothetical protein
MNNLRKSPPTVNDNSGFPPPHDRRAWDLWWRQLFGLARLAAKVDPHPPLDLILRSPAPTITGQEK